MYRIGRSPDPWRLNFEAVAPGERNFGNRFDDPDGRYGVLYASSSHLGCFMETLAPFRKPPTGVIAALQDIQHADSDPLTLGVVPASWLRARRMGTTQLTAQRYADIYSSEWLSHLRRELEWQQPTDQFDLHDLLTKDRSVSQKVSSHIYATKQFDGIYYYSRHGSDLENWALFEPFDLAGTASSELHAEDPDFQEALERLDLKLNPSC